MIPKEKVIHFDIHLQDIPWTIWQLHLLQYLKVYPNRLICSEFFIKLSWHLPHTHDITIDVHHLYYCSTSCYSFKHYMYINIALRVQVMRCDGHGSHHDTQHHNRPPSIFATLMVRQCGLVSVSFGHWCRCPFPAGDISRPGVGIHRYANSTYTRPQNPHFEAWPRRVYKDHTESGLFLEGRQARSWGNT